MQSRKEMEAEADRIGVPWTHTTTDDELHSMIQAHRDRLQGEDQMSDQAEAPEVQEEQQCHGLYWDFPKAPECKICTGQESCYHRFTQVTFPEMLKAAGPESTIEELALALDVSQEAVLMAQNEVKKVYPVVPKAKTEDADKSGNGRLAQNENPMDFVDADELEDASVQPEDPGESLELPATEEIEPDAEPKSDPEPMPEMKMPVEKKASSKSSKKKKAPAKTSKKKASSKASSKKKGVKKTSSKKAPPEETPAQEETEAQDPSPAESVKTAKAPAGTTAQAQNAASAKGQADPVKTTEQKSRKRRPNKRPTRPPKLDDGRLADPWGKHTWKKRWARERKGKYIKQLRPGMKLTRKYKGTLYEVVVLKKYYRYNGRDYPTLYSVVKEITGTKTSLRQPDEKGRRPEGTRQLCNWNAVRFFSLKALFSKP